VGHTCDEVKRRYNHKNCCTNEKGKKYNYFVYKFLRDHGSWDNWSLIVHETLAVENKAAAVLRERYWLEFYNATLNIQVPGRTPAEYSDEHREAIKQRSIKYNDEHREAINQRSIEYNTTNEAHIKEKHACDCGGKYTTNHRLRHIRTARHCTFITAQAAI
jgi:hypothetical protein